ncbi:hypothetical protein BHE74_00015888 [Ensete ventricosum]|nr:hypothetical protein BHE74_00015888 [Ensete ventricosum]
MRPLTHGCGQHTRSACRRPLGRSRWRARLRLLACEAAACTGATARDDHLTRSCPFIGESKGIKVRKLKDCEREREIVPLLVATLGVFILMGQGEVVPSPSMLTTLLAGSKVLMWIGDLEALGKVDLAEVTCTSGDDMVFRADVSELTG